MTDAPDANGAEQNRDRETSIVQAFVHLADSLIADFDVIDFLQYLIDRCVELTDTDEAAIMLVAPTGQLRPVASSTERSWLIELFETQTNDGPCLDAFRAGSVITSSNLAIENDRWPRFAQHAVSVGFRSVHSVPLRLRDSVIGALNLLRVNEGELPTVDAELARALSDIATVGLLQHQAVQKAESTASALEHALTSRVRIEQAKGIVSERADVSIDEAFERIRKHARNNRLGVGVVAQGVVDRSIDLGP